MHRLKVRLLASGISRAAVMRYLQELSDHREDLICELTAAGMAPGEAEAAADARLGDLDTLAQPMLDDPRFQSLAGRAPLLVWIGLPVLAQAALVAACAAIIVAAARTGIGSDGLGAATGLLLFVAPVAFGWSLSHLAAGRYVQPSWPMAGIGLSLLVAASLRLQVTSAEVAISLAAPDLLQLAAYAFLAPLPLFLRRTRID